MTIQGISGYAMPTVLPGTSRAPGTQGPETTPGQGLGGARPTEAHTARAVGRAGDAVPSEAPAGTDPMLWSVLTTEERSFFARARSMGQLTYGPGSRGRAAPPTGGRVDLRV